MLSRKQSWRRASSTAKILPEDLYAHTCGNNSPYRSLSDGSINLSDMKKEGRMWATTGDLTDPPSISASRRKNVNFGCSVRVILIPTREEYKTAGVDNLLWWVDDDYKSFKTAAMSELRETMRQFSLKDSKEAIKILYQSLPTLPEIEPEEQGDLASKQDDVHQNENNQCLQLIE